MFGQYVSVLCGLFSSIFDICKSHFVQLYSTLLSFGFIHYMLFMAHIKIEVKWQVKQKCLYITSNMWKDITFDDHEMLDIFTMSQWWHSSHSNLGPGPRFNIKMSSYQYRKSHCGDKTVVRSSYLHNVISYTGKTASLYWFSPKIECKDVVLPVYEFLLWI